MTFSMKCPSCDQPITLDDSMHRQRNRCDKCGGSFLAWNPDPSYGQDGPVEGVKENLRPRSPTLPRETFLGRGDDDREGGARPMHRASGASSLALWILLGAGGLGVLLCVMVGGIVLAVWFTAGAAPNPAPPLGVQQPPMVGAPAPPPSLQGRARFFVANPSCLSLSGEGTRLAVGSYDKTVRVFHVRTQEEIAVFAGHDDSIHSVALSPDGKWLASAGKDRRIRLWDVAQKERIHTLATKFERPVVQFLPDGKTLAIAGYDDGIALLDVQTRAIRDTLKYGREVVSFSITPDGNYLAMANYDIRVWDLRARREIIRLNGHRGQIEAVSLSADGQLLASGSADATIKIWDVKLGKARRTIRQSRSVLSLVMTSNGEVLASAALTEGTIRLWNASDGREIETLGMFGPLLMGQDGKTLVTGVNGQWVMMWDLSSLDRR